MKKLTFLLLAILLGPMAAFANHIVCTKDKSTQSAFEFRSDHPVPDWSFEEFSFRAAYGVVLVNGKNLGPQWLSVTNAGLYLNYEIKMHNAARRPVGHVHLSLHRSGTFNGYQQYDHPHSGRLVLEQLSCVFKN